MINWLISLINKRQKQLLDENVNLREQIRELRSELTEAVYSKSAVTSDKQLTVGGVEQALAVEHMKVQQLTNLQATTESNYQSALTLVRHTLVRNKELIFVLYGIQSTCIVDSASDTYDNITAILRKHERWSENFSRELSGSLNVDHDAPLVTMPSLKLME